MVLIVQCIYHVVMYSIIMIMMGAAGHKVGGKPRWPWWQWYNLHHLPDTPSHSEQGRVTASTMPDMQNVALGNHPIQIPSGNQDTAVTSLTLTPPPQSSPASWSSTPRRPSAPSPGTSCSGQLRTSAAWRGVSSTASSSQCGVTPTSDILLLSAKHIVLSVHRNI